MNPLRCAVYARYSTDKQNPLSIEDQVRKCREFASNRGWTVLDKYIFTDEAASGATKHRTGLQRMTTVAKSLPRPFEVILAEDSSRLSRHMADILSLCEQLIFDGIRICFVSQGIDSSDQQFRLMISARGLIDQLFLDDTSNRVHRGMEGLVKRGRHTGGRCFGYRSQKTPDGVVLEIEEAQAQIVRRLFTLYTNGWSLKRLAKAFNSEGILPPQAQSGRVASSWCPTAIRQILKNRRYTGKLIWNTTKKVRDPRTGRRVKRPRPQSEWLTADAPHLRIVSDELFEAVQKRFNNVNEKFGRKSGRPGLANGLRGNGYPFSGFLKCASCGANLVLVSGRGRRGYDRYGCPQNFYRGTCSNTVTIRRDWLEEQLIQGLQVELLSEFALADIVNGIAKALQENHSALCGEEQKLLQRKNTLQNERDNLIHTIASGFDSDSVRAAILDRENEIDQVNAKLNIVKRRAFNPGFNQLKAFAISKLQDLRILLGKPDNVPEFRNMLENRVGTIQMEPTEHNGDTCYLAKGRLDFLTWEEQSRWVGAAGRS